MKVTKAKGKGNPARYENATEMAVRNDKDIPCIYTFLFVLPVVLANL